MANSEKDHMVSGAQLSDKEQFEYSLQPKRFGEFIGQQKVKDKLAIAIQAARAHAEGLDHVLLCGPPGLGKSLKSSNNESRISGCKRFDASRGAMRS